METAHPQHGLVILIVMMVHTYNNIAIYFNCAHFYDNGDCVYDNDADGFDT